jgi:hypothetical protein
MRSTRITTRLEKFEPEKSVKTNILTSLGLIEPECSIDKLLGRLRKIKGF